MPCTRRKQGRFEELINFDLELKKRNVSEKECEEEADSVEVNPFPEDIRKNFKISVDIKYVSTSEKLREKEVELSTIVAMCELKRLQHMCSKKD